MRKPTDQNSAQLLALHVYTDNFRNVQTFKGIQTVTIRIVKYACKFNYVA